MTNDQFCIKDGRNPRHYRIDDEFLDDGWGQHVGVDGIAAYNVLARHANIYSQEAHPSYTTIAKKTGMSRRQAIRAVKKLLSFHLILIVQQRGKPNTYVLADKSQWGQKHTRDSVSLVTDSHLTSDRQSLDVVTVSHPTSDSESPKSIYKKASIKKPIDQSNQKKSFFEMLSHSDQTQLCTLCSQYPDATPRLTPERLAQFCQEHTLTVQQLQHCFETYADRVIHTPKRYLGYIHKVLENQGGVNSVPQAQPYGKAEPAPLPIGADTWTQVLQQIHRRMDGSPAYSMWIHPLVPCTITPARWCFQVPDDVFIHQVTDCYLPLLQEEIHAITGTTPTIDFVVHSQQEAA